MKKEYRVKKNEEFARIISKKKSVANQAFVIYFLENDIEHYRVGISVSKKLGNAVVRNKTKRQVRMLVNNIFSCQQDKDYIIIVRNKFLELDYQQRAKELNFLLKKIKKKAEG